MKKNGFTLVELLVVILIIGLIGAISVISYRSIFSTAEEKYYNAIESNLLLAGNDYFKDHREALPVGSEYSEVLLTDLIEAKYIEEVKDANGNTCTNGSVFVYREDDKFKYVACLRCGEYSTDGKYCNEPVAKVITITSKKAGSNTDNYYDVLKSFNSQVYSNGRNILVTLKMDSEYSVKKYVIENTKNSSNDLNCIVTSNNSCTIEVEKTGAYRVIAYDNNDKVLSSRYINIKIAKGQPNFDIDILDKYLITKKECNSNINKKNISFNIIKQTNEDYESISYQIIKYDGNNQNILETKEPRGLKIEESLESGKYRVDIIVKNYSDDNEKMLSKEFVVAYPIDLEYEDDHTTTTHEVVYGQVYNYLSPLPKTKIAYGSELGIKWNKDDSEINPDSTKVVDICTHELIGKTKQSCNKPRNVLVSTDGIVTWIPSSNCSNAQHQISLDKETWTNATSGVNLKNSLTQNTNTKVVYVKAISSNPAFFDSDYEESEPVNIYSVTLDKTIGISNVSGNGNYIKGANVSLSATVDNGYTFGKWTRTSDGNEVSTTNPYTGIINSNLSYIANANANSYLLHYSDNIFTARNQVTNGMTVTYTEDGSYLTLNGNLSKTSSGSLWSLDRRTFKADDEYEIIIKHVSGSVTCKDVSGCVGSSSRPKFVFELTIDGVNFDDRKTSPSSYRTINFPTSGEVTEIFTVGSNRVGANGIKFWVWQNTAGNTTFNNYKVQILISKVHHKNIIYNLEYGALDTPVKNGYTFNGWYTAVSGGTKVTSTTKKSTLGDQTLYAQYTSHKLTIEYNGNGSNVKWCSKSSDYNMDTNKYVTKSSVRYKEVIPYGQNISYKSGFSDYNNDSYICFSKLGNSAVSGNEWITKDKNKKYNQATKTYNAQDVSSDNGCNLLTEENCYIQVNVNWAPNTYSITLDNQGATKEGTTKVYYKYGETSTINGTKCYYYTNSNLSTCITDGQKITKPEKTGYTYSGYYTEINGKGTNYINSSGTFINNLYQKDPVEINEDYKDDITLYAKWVANELVFNNQSISLAYSTSESSSNIVVATNGTGTYTYTEVSEKNASGSSTNYISISDTKINIVAKTPVGTYAYKIKATDSNSGVTKEATYTITISKASTTPPTLADTTATYDGKWHFVGVSGGTTGLTVKYAYRTWNGSSYGNWSSWGTEDRYFGSVDAGKWEIKAKVVGNNNYSDSNESNIVTLLVNKANNVITIDPKTDTYNGQGKSASASALSGTPTIAYYSDSGCKTKTTTSNAESAGGKPINVGTYYAKASVSETTNYKATESSCKKAVVINKLDISCAPDGHIKTFTSAEDPSSVLVEANDGTCLSVLSGHTAIVNAYAARRGLGSQTITISSVTIKKGTVDVTANYNITYGTSILKVCQQQIVKTATNTTCSSSETPLCRANGSAGTIHTIKDNYCECNNGNCKIYKISCKQVCE